MDIRNHKASIDYLIKETKRTKDVAWLVKRLRDPRNIITMDLRNFIASLLEVKYSSEKLTQLRPSIGLLQLDIQMFKEMLSGNTEIPWKDIEKILINNGLQDIQLDTKGGITKAAKSLTMRLHNLTESQLDEIINKRKRK